jgi:pentatricopeptide repeat protein
MDSCLLSNDSEELFWGYGIVEPESAQVAFSLVGIVDTYHLAIAGRIKDVSESIRYGGYINDGLAGACRGGHEELALLMIQEMESAGIVPNLDWHLSEACRGGQKKLALLIIRKAESSEAIVDFDGGLLEACENNHKELALLMIEKGATRIQWGLEVACGEGHMELALLLIHKIESSGDLVKFDRLLATACRGGHKGLLGLIIQKIKSSGDAIECLRCFAPLDKH